MTIKDLLTKRLVLVSGKGGVGKTTVAVLLAQIAAKLGKKTLIVEMNSSDRVAPLFGLTSIGHKETSVAPNIAAINLNPKQCFEEYVLKHIRFKSIYKTFFNNTFVSNFLDAVPGLNDALMLGKIYELEQMQQAKVQDELEYDFIIVDAPATGHGLSALEVPNVLKSAVKIGPLHKHAICILDLLGDHTKTAFCLVTLAEEMPVAESIEYIQSLKEKTQLNFGPAFINAVHPDISKIKLPKEQQEIVDLVRFYDLTRSRAQLNQDYISILRKKLTDFDFVTLPYLFHEIRNIKDIKPLLDCALKGVKT